MSGRDLEPGRDERRRRIFNCPTLQIARDPADINRDRLARRALSEMSAQLRLVRGLQPAVDVSHDVLWSELMFGGGHGITFTRAGTGRASTVLSAIRARNSRERTVLSGSRFSLAISS